MNTARPRIQLYSYPTSPYAEKVGCYLKYKQLQYELIPVNPITNKQIRFTGQRQVPVLKIGDEWRKESSELGLWLNELFPERPIMPLDETAREAVLKVDRWISDSLIPTKFRPAVDWENMTYPFHNGWTLARAVHDATPLPWGVRAAWPVAIKHVGFIRHMLSGMDRTESVADLITRMCEEFVEHLQGGPYLAAQESPTLADLSAYPILISGHLLGLKTKVSFFDNPVIVEWCRRVQAHLPDNPLLVPDRLIVGEHV